MPNVTTDTVAIKHNQRGELRSSIAIVRETARPVTKRLWANLDHDFIQRFPAPKTEPRVIDPAFLVGVLNRVRCLSQHKPLFRHIHTGIPGEKCNWSSLSNACYWIERRCLLYILLFVSSEIATIWKSGAFSVPSVKILIIQDWSCWNLYPLARTVENM